MAQKKQRVTNAAGKRLENALAKSTTKVKVKHLKAKINEVENLGKNPNQAWTARSSNTQGYDKDTKRYTRMATSSKNGRLAVEGGGSKEAETHTMSYIDENGVRRSGRSGKTVNRRKRDYDVRVGINNDQRSPEAIARLRAMGIEVMPARALTTG